MNSKLYKNFQYPVVSSFIDSGAGFVLSILFVTAVVLTSENNFYNCEANNVDVVRCSCNERTNRLRVYRRLLTYMVKQLNYVWQTAEIKA